MRLILVASLCLLINKIYSAVLVVEDCVCIANYQTGPLAANSTTASTNGIDLNSICQNGASLKWGVQLLDIGNVTEQKVSLLLSSVGPVVSESDINGASSYISTLLQVDIPLDKMKYLDGRNSTYLFNSGTIINFNNECGPYHLIAVLQVRGMGNRSYTTSQSAAILKACRDKTSPGFQLSLLVSHTIGMKPRIKMKNGQPIEVIGDATIKIKNTGTVPLAKRTALGSIDLMAITYPPNFFQRDSQSIINDQNRTLQNLSDHVYNNSGLNMIQGLLSKGERLKGFEMILVTSNGGQVLNPGDEIPITLSSLIAPEKLICNVGGYPALLFLYLTIHDFDDAKMQEVLFLPVEYECSGIEMDSSTTCHVVPDASDNGKSASIIRGSAYDKDTAFIYDGDTSGFRKERNMAKIKKTLMENLIVRQKSERLKSLNLCPNNSIDDNIQEVINNSILHEFKRFGDRLYQAVNAIQIPGGNSSVSVDKTNILLLLSTYQEILQILVGEESDSQLRNIIIALITTCKYIHGRHGPRGMRAPFGNGQGMFDQRMNGQGMFDQRMGGPGMSGQEMFGHGIFDQEINGHGMSGQGRRDQGMFGPRMNGKGIFGQGINGQGMSDQGRGDQGMFGQGWSDQGINGPGMRGQGRRDQGIFGQGMSGQGRDQGMFGQGIFGQGINGPGMRGQGRGDQGMFGQGMSGQGRDQGMFGQGMSGQSEMGGPSYYADNAVLPDLSNGYGNLTSQQLTAFINQLNLYYMMSNMSSEERSTMASAYDLNANSASQFGNMTAQDIVNLISTLSVLYLSQSNYSNEVNSGASNCSQFMCGSGVCINNSQVCDMISNCYPGFEDEKNCTYTLRKKREAEVGQSYGNDAISKQLLGDVSDDNGNMEWISTLHKAVKETKFSDWPSGSPLQEPENIETKEPEITKSRPRRSSKFPFKMEGNHEFPGHHEPPRMEREVHEFTMKLLMRLSSSKPEELYEFNFIPLSLRRKLKEIVTNFDIMVRGLPMDMEMDKDEPTFHMIEPWSLTLSHDNFTNTTADARIINLKMSMVLMSSPTLGTPQIKQIVKLLNNFSMVVGPDVEQHFQSNADMLNLYRFSLNLLSVITNMTDEGSKLYDQIHADMLFNKIERNLLKGQPGKEPKLDQKCQRAARQYVAGLSHANKKDDEGPVSDIFENVLENPKAKSKVTYWMKHDGKIFKGQRSSIFGTMFWQKLAVCSCNAKHKHTHGHDNIYSKPKGQTGNNFFRPFLSGGVSENYGFGSSINFGNGEGFGVGRGSGSSQNNNYQNGQNANDNGNWESFGANQYQSGASNNGRQNGHDQGGNTAQWGQDVNNGQSGLGGINAQGSQGGNGAPWGQDGKGQGGNSAHWGQSINNGQYGQGVNGAHGNHGGNSVPWGEGGNNGQWRQGGNNGQSSPGQGGNTAQWGQSGNSAQWGQYGNNGQLGQGVNSGQWSQGENSGGQRGQSGHNAQWGTDHGGNSSQWGPGQGRNSSQWEQGGNSYWGQGGNNTQWGLSQWGNSSQWSQRRNSSQWSQGGNSSQWSQGGISGQWGQGRNTSQYGQGQGGNNSQYAQGLGGNSSQYGQGGNSSQWSQGRNIGQWGQGVNSSQWSQGGNIGQWGQGGNNSQNGQGQGGNTQLGPGQIGNSSQRGPGQGGNGGQWYQDGNGGRRPHGGNSGQRPQDGNSGQNHQGGNSGQRHRGGNSGQWGQGGNIVQGGGSGQWGQSENDIQWGQGENNGQWGQGGQRNQGGNSGRGENSPRWSSGQGGNRGPGGPGQGGKGGSGGQRGNNGQWGQGENGGQWNQGGNSGQNGQFQGGNSNQLGQGQYGGSQMGQNSNVSNFFSNLFGNSTELQNDIKNVMNNMFSTANNYFGNSFRRSSSLLSSSTGRSSSKKSIVRIIRPSLTVSENETNIEGIVVVNNVELRNITGQLILGTICEDGFGPVEAAVICKQFIGREKHLAASLQAVSISEEEIGLTEWEGNFTQYFPNITLVNVQCSDNDTDILNCSHSAWNDGTVCPSRKRAAVKCNLQENTDDSENTVDSNNNMEDSKTAVEETTRKAPQI